MSAAAEESSENSNEGSGGGSSSPIPMNGGVPSPGGGGDSSCSSSSSSSSSLLDCFKQQFNIATVARVMAGNSSPEDARFDPSDDDFPHNPDFDFERTWENISADLDQEEEEEYSDFFSECAANNREAAVQWHLSISEEGVLRELQEADTTLVYPPESEMKEIVGKLRPRVDDGASEGAPACKRAKRASDPKRTERASSSSRSRHSSESSDSQYVFVIDKVTQGTDVISLRKGEELPDGYELASIQNNFANVPGELSSLDLDKLKGAISKSQKRNSAGNSSQSSPRAPSSEPGPSEVPNGGEETSPSRAEEPPEEQVSQTNGRKSKRLACLSDLMTQEIKTKSKTPSPTTTSTPSPRPGFKLSLTNRTAAIRASDSLATPDLDIIQLKSDKDDMRNKKYLNPNPNSFKISTANANRSNSSKPMVKVPAQRKIISSSLSQAKQTKSQNTAGPVIISAQSLTRPEPDGTKIKPLLQCAFCQERFLCYEDDLFRKHAFLKHEFDIQECKQFDDRRVFEQKLMECNKCRTYVVNTEDHQRTCGGARTFELVVVVQNKLLKHGCGICGKVFPAKYELQQHIDEIHVNFSPKIILSPMFRCAQCLKRFDNAFNLTKHCISCMELHPRPESIQELAKLYLHCDICSGTHSTLDETSNCYFRKNILRCAICLDIYKDKGSFVKHLHTLHGLQFHIVPTMTLPCPFCPNLYRGRYQEIFPHIVGDHFDQIIKSSNLNSIVPRYGFQRRMDSQDPSLPKVTSVVGNFKQSPQPRRMPDLKPVPRMTAVQQSPAIRINTNRITPTFAPGTVATTSGRIPPIVIGSNGSFVDVNGRKLLYLGPTTAVGTKTIHIPHLQNAMAFGNSLGGYKLVRSASGATGPIRFAVSSAANPLLRTIGPGTTRLPASSTSTPAQQTHSLVRYSSTATTITSQSSTPKVPISKQAPNVPNQTPVIVKKAPGEGTPPAQGYRLKQLINTVRQTQNPLPIPNLPPGMSVHHVSGTSSSSSSTCSSPSNASTNSTMTITLTPAASASQTPTSSSIS